MKYILLHGLGQTGSSWEKTINAMEEEGEVRDISCPNLKHWLQDRKACYGSLYRGLEDYCGQFDEPICLGGLSLGGILAMQYGIEHPEKVKSLVLIGAQYTMPKMLLKLQNLFFHLMPEKTFQKIGFAKTDFIGLCWSMAQLEFTDDLKKIRCKVLAVCGEQDRANKDATLQLAERIQNAEVCIIEGAGHEVNTDNPKKLGEVLGRFWREP